jgi:predicted nucleotidyltransferase
LATTVQQGFAILKSNLEITGLQHTTVSERQQAVRAAVARRLTVTDSFLTGSYARKTMIAPLNEADIDVFVVLDSGYFHQYSNRGDGQAALLDQVRSVLRGTYPKTPDISRNGQAVTIRFTDFLVDVVPAFDRRGGGYLIPNSISKTWIPTDPNAHVKILSEANKAHDGELVPVIKMIKAWNKTIERFFHSFHLEVLALEVFNGVHISDYPSGTRFFFDKVRALIPKKNPDPAGYSEDIGAYINTTEKVKAAVSKFDTVFEIAVEAEAANRYGNIREAFAGWRRVFGDHFPAYG